MFHSKFRSVPEFSNGQNSASMKILIYHSFSDIHTYFESVSVILCGTTGIVHTTLSANCSSRPGESCDYTCNYGYERNPQVAALTCTDDSGAWNHNLSSLCRGIV